jgi:hypothetical protein
MTSQTSARSPINSYLRKGWTMASGREKTRNVRQSKAAGGDENHCAMVDTPELALTMDITSTSHAVRVGRAGKTLPSRFSGTRRHRRCLLSSVGCSRWAALSDPNILQNRPEKGGYNKRLRPGSNWRWRSPSDANLVLVVGGDLHRAGLL